MKNKNRRIFMNGIAATFHDRKEFSEVFLQKNESGEETVSSMVASFDIMKQVSSYRKIDSHAHVFFFSADSPATQLDMPDDLRIEKTG